jgi:hypothetical protein
MSPFPAIIALAILMPSTVFADGCLFDGGEVRDTP